jgi:imidazolonepropionase-like amidohydrolase
MKRSYALATLVLLIANLSMPVYSQTTYEFSGGWWFNGKGFVRQKLYAVNGIFQKRRASHVDKVIELGDLYIVPPFADAHSHAFDNPKSIDDAVATNLRDGIFYGFSLTNSIKGKTLVADKVNKPDSIDVGYADAGLTATLGHPILSAEVTANGIPWDALAANWSRLLKSHTAEGDAYFVIDNLDELEKKWPRIISSKPDVIKIFLLDTENFEEHRRSTTTINDKGLDPILVPAIVARAHGSKLRVVAHVETAADFRVAVRAGVDIIAHLPGLAPKKNENLLRYELTEADAELAKRKGVSVVATAWLAERLAAPKPWLSGAAAEADTAQLERAKEIQRHSLKRLMDHGVPIAIGSDLYENATTEASYLERLGVFDSPTLLQMWSRTTAQLIFPKRRIGQLTAGYEASLLALSCDPLKDFACTRQISIRMKQGRLLSTGN